MARWGLVPFFTKDIKEVKGLSTINARAETIATAKTWREPFRKRRCLVPADAFYEWPKEGKAPKTWNLEAASAVGKKIAERALAKGVKEVVFDRGGYIYHGRIKALADAAREGGLEF